MHNVLYDCSVVCLCDSPIAKLTMFMFYGIFGIFKVKLGEIMTYTFNYRQIVIYSACHPILMMKPIKLVIWFSSTNYTSLGQVLYLGANNYYWVLNMDKLGIQSNLIFNGFPIDINLWKEDYLILIIIVV